MTDIILVVLGALAAGAIGPMKDVWLPSEWAGGANVLFWVATVALLIRIVPTKLVQDAPQGWRDFSVGWLAMVVLTIITYFPL